MIVAEHGHRTVKGVRPPHLQDARPLPGQAGEGEQLADRVQDADGFAAKKAGGATTRRPGSRRCPSASMSRGRRTCWKRRSRRHADDRLAIITGLCRAPGSATRSDAAWLARRRHDGVRRPRRTEGRRRGADAPAVAGGNRQGPAQGGDHPLRSLGESPSQSAGRSTRIRRAHPRI
jgi:hypothetical protein